jgi:hypothetical protein
MAIRDLLVRSRSFDIDFDTPFLFVATGLSGSDFLLKIEDFASLFPFPALCKQF